MNMVLDQTSVLHGLLTRPERTPAQREAAIVGTIKTALDTPAGFRAWLRSKARSEDVGVAGDSDNCPLKNWLSSLNLAGHIKISADYAYVYTDPYDPHYEKLTLPLWAYNFVVALDSREKNGQWIAASYATYLLDYSV